MPRSGTSCKTVLTRAPIFATLCRTQEPICVCSISTNACDLCGPSWREGRSIQGTCFGKRRSYGQHLLLEATLRLRRTVQSSPGMLDSQGVVRIHIKLQGGIGIPATLWANLCRIRNEIVSGLDDRDVSGFGDLGFEAAPLRDPSHFLIGVAVYWRRVLSRCTVVPPRLTHVASVEIAMSWWNHLPTIIKKISAIPPLETREGLCHSIPCSRDLSQYSLV